MMELNDSSDELSRVRDQSKHSEEARSGLGLGIDLNEIPSPSLAETLPDSFDVVRAYHDNPLPAPGGPAELPGNENDSASNDNANDARGSGTCAACGGPEVKGHVVVCDGCERGFHIGCAGTRAGRQVLSHDEWVCTDCEGGGVKSKRWPLGVKSKRILDINSSPPSDADADGDGSMELSDSRYVWRTRTHSFNLESLYLKS